MMIIIDQLDVFGSIISLQFLGLLVATPCTEFLVKGRVGKALISLAKAKEAAKKSRSHSFPKNTFVKVSDSTPPRDILIGGFPQRIFFENNTPLFSDKTL